MTPSIDVRPDQAPPLAASPAARARTAQRPQRTSQVPEISGRGRPEEPAVGGHHGGEGQVGVAQQPLVARGLRGRQQAPQRAPVRVRARRQPRLRPRSTQARMRLLTT